MYSKYYLLNSSNTKELNNISLSTCITYHINDMCTKEELIQIYEFCIKENLGIDT